MSLVDAFFVLHRPSQSEPWDRDVIEADARATDPGASWRFLECGHCFLGWRGGPSRPEGPPAPGLFTGSINADEMRLLSAYMMSWPDSPGPAPADGAFAGAVVDRERGRVTLVTDRFGLYPLYRAEKDGTSGYATSLPLIRAVARGDRVIEEASIHEMVLLGLVLEGRTFLRDVRLVAPASMVRLEEGPPDARPYWTWRSLASGPPAGAATSDDDLARETYRLIEEAVLKSLPAGFSKIGVPLSGGLDSRMICAVLARNGIPFHAYHVTHGHGKEVAQARQVAQALRMPFTPIDAYRNPTISIPAALDASDRGYRTDQTWGYEMAEAMAADGCSVLLDGLAFDAVLGAVLRVQGDDPDDLAQALEHVYRDVLGTFLGEVAGPRTSQKAEESMRASLKAVAGECIDRAGPLASEFFVMNYRVRRYTFGYCLANMGVLPGRFPFVSREIFEHCMRLPVAQREQSRLYRRIYQVFFPDLARIPWAKTGLPLDQYATPRHSYLQDFLCALVRRATLGRRHIGQVSTFEDLLRSSPNFQSAIAQACDAPSLYSGHDWSGPLRKALSSQRRGRDMAYLILPFYVAQRFLSWDAPRAGVIEGARHSHTGLS